MTMNFKRYLAEKAPTDSKSVHLENIEDDIIAGGVNGARDSINFLKSLRDMLAGHSNSKVNLATKWHSYMDIIAGINPENGKFFVGTPNSGFIDNTPLSYTEGDIDANYSDKKANACLKIALRYLPKLDITGVLHGGIMFTKGDIKTENIDGIDYITFQPNDVVYAVPADSKLATSMMNAQLGIVFNMSYTGKTMGDMKSSMNIDINHLTTTKDVWFRDAYFVDASGTASFTNEETVMINKMLSTASSTFESINPMTMNRIAASDNIRSQIKNYFNSVVKSGEKIQNTSQYTSDMIKSVSDKLNADILDTKKMDTKLKRQTEKNDTLRFYRENAAELKKMFDLYNLVVDSKNMIVSKLQAMKQVTGTFVRTDNGFRITSPEGFVCIDKINGNAVKLVDRMEFNQDGFTPTKNWTN